MNSTPSDVLPPSSSPRLAERGSPRLARAQAIALSHALPVTIAILCSGILVWQAREYMPFFEDDAFISLRYAWRLLHGHGLTWTDGEAVEGYSNLLWVLLVAAGGLFSRDLVWVSRVMGVSLTVIAVLAVVYAYKPRRLRDVISPLVGGLAMTLTSPIAAWSIGGLEQPLLAALVAWATVQSYRLADGSADARTASRVGVLLGLAAITRPDAGLFTVTTCAALLLPRRLDRRMLKATARIAAIAGVFFCGQVGFRRFYYGAWLPNTAHVKVAFTTARLSAGWQYVAGAEPYLWSLLVMALAATAVAMTQQASRRRVVIPIAGALVWTGYVVFIGGDYMPARRYLVPAIVLLSLVTAEGLDTLIKRRWVLKAEGTDPSSRALSLDAVAGVLAALCLAALARAQSDDPEKQHAMHDNWSWSGREVGGFLARAFAADRPLVAVDAAGSLPYFAPELPCLDMLGLNDRFIATHHPPDFGTGFIGHELGDGAYLLRRKPDLIAFHTPLGDKNAEWRGGKEMKQAPEFGQHYQLVTFATPEGVQTLLWVRKDDGRIGVKRTELEVSVPGYLLFTPPGGVAELDAEGRVGLRIDGEHRADLVGLHLDPGQWEARVDASGDVDARMLAPIAARGDGSSQTEFKFEARESSPVRMSFTLRGGNRAHVRGVVFRKIVN